MLLTNEICTLMINSHVMRIRQSLGRLAGPIMEI